MQILSLFEAKTHLSRVVASLVNGSEDQVIIVRHCKPVARVTPLHKADVSKRVGLARGRFKVPDNIDKANPAIAALFGVKGVRKRDFWWTSKSHSGHWWTVQTDPFDRILVAQTIAEPLRLLTHDRLLPQYGDSVLFV